MNHLQTSLRRFQKNNDWLLNDMGRLLRDVSPHVAVECLQQTGMMNAANEQGQTPSMAAVQGYSAKDSIELIIALHAAGADLYAMSNNGETVLSFALQHNNDALNVTRAVLALTPKLLHHTSLRWPLLKTALMYSEPGTVAFLLEQGMNANEVDMVGRSTLEEAIVRRQLDDVVALLNAGADVKRPTPYGDPLLHRALRLDPEDVPIEGTFTINEAIVRALLDAGADPQSLNEHGTPALHIAVAMPVTRSQPGRSRHAIKASEEKDQHQREQRRRLVQALLDGGADVNHQTSNGRRALYEAVRQANDHGLLRTLLLAGAHWSREMPDGVLGMTMQECLRDYYKDNNLPHFHQLEQAAETFALRVTANETLVDVAPARPRSRL